MSPAISAASIKNVPLPHSGSISGSRRAARSGQPAMMSSAAARFSLSGAAVEVVR
jgi:hypothetical protein